MKIRKISSYILAAMLTVLTTACSRPPAGETPQTALSEVSQTTDSTGEHAPEGNDSEYPIVIEHAFGETVLEQKPERVVTIAWANQDTPLALGVVPVGFSMANFGPVDELGMHSWTADRAAELGETAPNVFRDTDGIDYEAVSDAQPDVILAAYSGLTREEYDLLSQIAPVVAYPRIGWSTYWREQIILNAAGMGMKPEGEAYVAKLEQQIGEVRAKYPQLEGKNGAFLWIDAADLSKFYLYFTNDTRAAYLTDLGIAFPKELQVLQTDDTSFAATVSTEHIDILNDLDIIVAYGDDTLLETLQADPLFGTVPAIRRGSVVFINSNTDLAGAATPSALSIPAIIDEYVALLAEAADKIQ